VLPGGVSSQATGINNQGQIVGFATTASGPNHGFSWKNGVMTDLGTIGGTFSQANGVNNNGRIVGFGHTAQIVNHVIAWTVTP
jgi:probable HAF family extracellular repeat protein